MISEFVHIGDFFHAILIYFEKLRVFNACYFVHLSILALFILLLLYILFLMMIL